MLYEAVGAGTVPEVAARLAEAVKANHFGIQGTIDLQAKLADKGVELQPACLIVEVCNPVLAQRVLSQEISMATMLPCRIAIYEKGGQVCVSTVRPTALLALVSSDGLGTVVRELEDAMLRIIDATCA